MSFVAWQVPAGINTFEGSTHGSTDSVSSISSAEFQSLSQSSESSASLTMVTSLQRAETFAEMTTRHEESNLLRGATTVTLENHYETIETRSQSTSSNRESFTSTASGGGEMTFVLRGTTVINVSLTRQSSSVTEAGSTFQTASWETLGTERVASGQTSGTSKTTGSASYGPSLYTETFSEESSTTFAAEQPSTIETTATTTYTAEFVTTSTGTETLTTVRATTVDGALSTSSTSTTRTGPTSSTATTSRTSWLVTTSASNHDAADLYSTLLRWDCLGVSTTTPATAAGLSCGSVWRSLNVSWLAVSPLTSISSESTAGTISGTFSDSEEQSASSAGTSATTSFSLATTMSSTTAHENADATTFLAGALGALPSNTVGAFTIFEAYITATATTAITVGSSTLTGIATTGTGTSSREAASAGAAHSRAHTISLAPGCYYATLIGGTNTTTWSQQNTGSSDVSTTLPAGSAAMVSAACFATAESTEMIRHPGSVLTTSRGCQISIFDP